MARKTAFPFFTIPDDAISSDGFLIGDPGQPLEPARDILDDWDYARELRVGFDLNLDVGSIINALDINEQELNLAVRFTAGTGTGKMPRSREQMEYRAVDLDHPHLSVRRDLPSSVLSGRLLLEAEILLASPPGTGAPLSPTLSGARLWSMSKDILLEGGGDSRFPMETLSFSNSTDFRGKQHENAPWFFYWRTGAWSSDFSAACRLYINSDQSACAERISEGDPLTLQAMMADVMSQVISHALNEKESQALDEHWEEGTVGDQLCTWAETVFPGKDAEMIRSLRDHQPGEFKASILAAASLGD